MPRPATYRFATRLRSKRRRLNQNSDSDHQSRPCHLAGPHCASLRQEGSLLHSFGQSALPSSVSHTMLRRQRAARARRFQDCRRGRRRRGRRLSFLRSSIDSFQGGGKDHTTQVAVADSLCSPPRYVRTATLDIRPRPLLAALIPCRCVFKPVFWSDHHS